MSLGTVPSQRWLPAANTSPDFIVDAGSPRTADPRNQQLQEDSEANLRLNRGERSDPAHEDYQDPSYASAETINAMLRLCQEKNEDTASRGPPEPAAKPKVHLRDWSQVQPHRKTTPQLAATTSTSIPPGSTRSDPPERDVFTTTPSLPLDTRLTNGKSSPRPPPEVNSFAKTSPSIKQSRPAPASSSGLFGTERYRPKSNQSLASRDTLQASSLRSLEDPFLTDLNLKELPRQPNEVTPLLYNTPLLFPRADAKKLRSKVEMQSVSDAPQSIEDKMNSTLWPVAMAIVITVLAVVSGVVLFMSFNESGHRSGYEDGHLDAVDDHTGCQAAFYWLLVQAICDLLVGVFLWMSVVLAIKCDYISFFGCVGTFRLCTLSVGFHILYLSRLDRNFCDEALMVWSTVVIWLGIAALPVLIYYLVSMLLSNGSNKQRRVQCEPLKSPEKVMSAPSRSHY